MSSVQSSHCQYHTSLHSKYGKDTQRNFHTLSLSDDPFKDVLSCAISSSISFFLTSILSIWASNVLLTALLWLQRMATWGVRQTSVRHLKRLYSCACRIHVAQDPGMIVQTSNLTSTTGSCPRSKEAAFVCLCPASNSVTSRQTAFYLRHRAAPHPAASCEKNKRSEQRYAVTVRRFPLPLSPWSSHSSKKYVLSNLWSLNHSDTENITVVVRGPVFTCILLEAVNKTLNIYLSLFFRIPHMQ